MYVHLLMHTRHLLYTQVNDTGLGYHTWTIATHRALIVSTMSNDENVLDLLDLLDVKTAQKSNPKKSSVKRKISAKKAAGDDLLQFLDELDPKKDTQKETKQEPQGSETAGPSTEHKESARDMNSESNEGEGEIPNLIDPMATISSWWSRNKTGLWSKAQETIQDAVTDAVKQARQTEVKVREEQTPFSLNSLHSRLTSVLNTIVPPISQHEQLKIHIFHDMIGYPSVDKLLYEVFDYVMDQVEGGGDLNTIVQKGKERHHAGSDSGVHRALNYVRCSISEGIKLAKASVEEIRSNTSNETIQKHEDEALPSIRVSEVFISIQPIITPKDSENPIAPSEELLYFIIYLTDLDHNIEISTASQALPYEWAQWLDNEGHGFEEAAIDPRDWVSGWVEDALNLAFGVIAQKYVTTRMGLTKVGNAEISQARE